MNAGRRQVPVVGKCSLTAASAFLVCARNQRAAYQTTDVSAWNTDGLFEAKGVSASRVSPPDLLSISLGNVGCLKAGAFPPPV
jgi:hypothetical protein